MAGRRRLAGLTAICVIGALALADSAGATTSVVHQKGITYVVTGTGAPVGNNLRDSLTAECENDIPVIGGGFFTEAPYGQMAMTGSIPVNVNTADPGLDGWSAAWRGSPSMGWGLQTIAICDETKPRYVEQTLKIKPSQRKATTVSCPSDRHVYSGGIGSEILQPGPLVASSYPVDSSADSDKARDDGWKVSADNESATKVTVSAFAVCGKVTPAYRSRGQSAAPGGSTAMDVPCPEGKLNPIGGGQKVSGGYGTTITNTSTTQQGALNRWLAEVDNFGTDEEKLTTHVVCVGRALK